MIRESLSAHDRQISSVLVGGSVIRNVERIILKGLPRNRLQRVLNVPFTIVNRHANTDASTGLASAN